MAWGGFLQVHAALIRRLDAELQAAHDLPLLSYEVLLHLHWAPENRMRISDLAGTVLLSLSGVSRLVDRLAHDGLVMRERSCEDRRGNYAVLTEAGFARLSEAHATHLAGVREYFLEHFSETELVGLADAWGRLLASAPEHTPGDAGAMG
jgi:DNA-binding MarR family transcriptional regulator